MLNMLNLDIKNTFEGIKENNYDSDNNSEHMNFDKKRLMTSPVNNSINTNNNSKINNYNRSTLNNFGQSNLPKINMTLNKEEGISNFNMSSYQMTNKSLQGKNKKDK